MPHLLFLGAVLGCEHPLAPRPVPANFKDPAKIREREEENRLRAERDARRVVTAGWLAGFALVDADGAVLADGDDRNAGPSPHNARDLIEALDAAWFAWRDVGLIVAGFDARTALRVAALQVMESNATGRPIRGAAAVLAAGCGEESRDGRVFRVVDPYELCVPAANRDDVDPTRLCRYLRVAGDPTGDDPVLLAMTALGLARAAGLFGLPAGVVAAPT